MEQKKSSWAAGFFKRYFIDAMSYMALGLFSSLIIGLILSQLSAIPYLGFLKPFADMVSATSPVVGAAIGNLLRNAIENSDRGLISVRLESPATVIIRCMGVIFRAVQKSASTTLLSTTKWTPLWSNE